MKNWEKQKYCNKSLCNFFNILPLIHSLIKIRMPALYFDLKQNKKKDNFQQN